MIEYEHTSSKLFKNPSKYVVSIYTITVSPKVLIRKTLNLELFPQMCKSIYMQVYKLKWLASIMNFTKMQILALSRNVHQNTEIVQECRKLKLYLI